MKKILLSAALAALSLNASGKINEGQSYGDWKGACDHGECAVIQIANDANRQPLAQLVLMKSPDKKQTAFRVTVPLRVDWRAGMLVQIDGEKLAVVPFQVCAEMGCMTFLPLEQKVLDKLRRGNKFRLSFAIAGSQKEEVAEFSLKGFTDALKNL